MYRFALATVAVALCAGCASSNESPAAGSEVRTERVYRTGSNLPTTEISRSATRTVDPETIRIPAPPPPRGTGN